MHINEDDFNLFVFRIALLFLPKVLLLFFLQSGQCQPFKSVLLHTSLLIFIEIFGWKWQESHSNHFQKKDLCNQTSKYQGWTDIVVDYVFIIELPQWLSGEESACNAGDAGSIPGSGASPGGGHGSPLQYSCLENPMDRGAWQATVPRVTKGRTQLKRLSTCTWCHHY